VQSIRWLVISLLITLSIPSHADTLRVAVASNFSAPMQEIASRFEASSGHRLLLSLGSTGKLYAQIRNGAPFDLLLAADDKVPSMLERDGLAVPDTRFTYAIGTLVLWSAREGYVDDQGAVLSEDSFKHLALANPKTAPYGTAARATLESLGLEQTLRDRLVQGENIAQAHQFVASGNAELGFVALSQLLDNNGSISKGSAWVVPAKLHPPIRQDAALLTIARDSQAARDLLTFLKSEEVTAIIKAYGYDRTEAR
jgi:molybdate transport system substrate-binding protein